MKTAEQLYEWYLSMVEATRPEEWEPGIPYRRHPWHHGGSALLDDSLPDGRQFVRPLFDLQEDEVPPTRVAFNRSEGYSYADTYICIDCQVGWTGENVCWVCTRAGIHYKHVRDINGDGWRQVTTVHEGDPLFEDV